MRSLKDILYALRCDDEISALLNDFLLISAVAFYNKKEDVEKWELIFYNSKEEKTYKIDIDKDENFSIFESELLDDRFKSVGISLEEEFIDEKIILKKAFEYYMKNYSNKEINKMFLVMNVLDKKWLLNLISSSLNVIQISFDLYTGEIIGSKEVPLIHVEK